MLLSDEELRIRVNDVKTDMNNALIAATLSSDLRMVRALTVRLRLLGVKVGANYVNNLMESMDNEDK